MSYCVVWSLKRGIVHEPLTHEQEAEMQRAIQQERDRPITRKEVKSVRPGTFCKDCMATEPEPGCDRCFWCGVDRCLAKARRSA